MYTCDICLDKKIDGNHHLGHILLECFKKRNPDDICQIDDATGEQETYGSTLNRVVLLAKSFRRAGLRPGDVLTLSGRNHLNIRITFYASLMCGLPLAALYYNYTYEEIRDALAVLRPKISFCDYENYKHYKQAVKELGLDTKIVTFYGGECSMSCFVEENYVMEFKEFRPSYFDTDKVYAWLACTSGSTGGHKFVALTHGAAVARLKFRTMLFSGLGPIKNSKEMYLDMQPINWVTSYYSAVWCPIMNIIQVQSSKMKLHDDVYADMVNKYKPKLLITNPPILCNLLRQKCDLTSLDCIFWAGQPFHKKMLHKLRGRVCNDTKILEGYGLTETGIILYVNGNEPAGSCGVRHCLGESKLVDPTSGNEVTEPHKYGEMWVRGPLCFSQYYNNPEATAKAITKDGWVKTGDLLYYDKNGYYYFAERLKKVIRNIRSGKFFFVSELEEVIQSHPGVLEVCVLSFLDVEYIACVVRAPGSDVTAQQIKDFVIDQVSEEKQLPGGVIFMASLPKTGSGKIARAKLQDCVCDMKKE